MPYEIDLAEAVCKLDIRHVPFISCITSEADAVY